MKKINFFLIGLRKLFLLNEAILKLHASVKNKTLNFRISDRISKLEMLFFSTKVQKQHNPYNNIKKYSKKMGKNPLITIFSMLMCLKMIIAQSCFRPTSPPNLSLMWSAKENLIMMAGSDFTNPDSYVGSVSLYHDGSNIYVAITNFYYYRGTNNLKFDVS